MTCSITNDNQTHIEYYKATFVGDVEVSFNEEVKVSEDLMLGKSIEETHKVIIEWLEVSGGISGFVRWK